MRRDRASRLPSRRTSLKAKLSKYSISSGSVTPERSFVRQFPSWRGVSLSVAARAGGARIEGTIVG